MSLGVDGEPQMSVAYKRMALPGGAMFLFEDMPDGEGAGLVVELVTVDGVPYVKIGSRHIARANDMGLAGGSKIFVAASGLDDIDIGRGLLLVLGNGSAVKQPEQSVKSKTFEQKETAACRP